MFTVSSFVAQKYGFGCGEGGMSTGQQDARDGATGRYHHGDLPAALLAAAEAILEEEGIEALSLRACARRAGVSHAAPAHHFGDLAGLLSAFAARAFQAMRDEVGRALPAAGSDPFERVRAAGLAYIAFARARPGTFKLMFRFDLLDAEHPALKLAIEQSHATLVGLVRALMPGAPEEILQVRWVMAWSLMHGFATLVLDGHFSLVCPPCMAPGLEDWLAEGIIAAIRPAFTY